MVRLKHLVLLILSLFISLSFASELMEELYLDELADALADSFYENPDSLNYKYEYLSLLKDKPYIRQNGFLEKDGFKVEMSSKLTNWHRMLFPASDYIYEQSEDPALSGNLRISYRDSFVLGSFRPAWGLGLLFQEAKNDRCLLSAPMADIYSPTGFGMSLNINGFSTFHFYSSQKRQAELDYGVIKKLYKNKDNKGTSVQETVFANSIGYYSPHFKTGLSYSAYEYDHRVMGHFDTYTWKRLNNLNLFADFRPLNHRFTAEGALQLEGFAIRTLWQADWRNYQQELGYTFSYNYEIPPYAKSMPLSSGGKWSELNASALYQIDEHSRIKLSSNANLKRDAIKDDKWRALSKAEYQYKDTRHKLNLSLVSIDREILAEQDDSYSSSIPQNWRFVISDEVKVHDSLSLSQSLRYHLQEKKASLDNGAIYTQGFTAKLGKGFESSGKVMLYNSAKHKLILLNEELQQYESFGNSGVNWELSGTYKRDANRVELKYGQDGSKRSLMLYFGFVSKLKNSP